MSWYAAEDPVLGDKHSCGALELVVVARTHDIGGLEVRRALPSVKRRLVGPFVFLDQMGPSVLAAGTGLDVRPHPHIGLSTLTYLFDGTITHRDSLGMVQDIRPSEVNWMTAGQGIVHSERTPERARSGPSSIYGLQCWVAMPAAQEEIGPSFEHMSADVFPVISAEGKTARVVAGTAFGRTAPLKTHSPTLFVDIALGKGASIPFDAGYEERALYIAKGRVSIAGDEFDAGQLLVFRAGDAITVTALEDARFALVGGDALEGPRYIWWNFVSSRKERIEEAKAQWAAGRFTMVPGEHEFIPLPG